MQLLNAVLPWIQIGLSVLLIGAILLQQSSAGVGGAFGGGDGGAYHSRRGLEKTLFHASIILGILFALTAFAQLII